MNPFEKELEWIASQRDVMLSRVEGWASINTGSLNVAGIRRLSQRLTPLFEKIGATAESVPLDAYESINDAGKCDSSALADALVFRSRPESHVRILLAIHLDTVYAQAHAFQATTRLDANTLCGPGVADAKGGVAVILTALEALERSDAAKGIGWTVVLNSDEELGSPGSAPLLLREAARHHAGLVFEPALPDGALISQRKGSGNFSLVVHGKSAHAGRDVRAGRNAVHATAEAVVALAAMQSESSELTVNVGRITGGGPVNVVPDLAVCHFNIRVPDALAQQRAGEELQRIVDTLNQRDGFSATLHGAFTAPPKSFNANTAALLEQIARCGTHLGLEITHRASGGVCDGNRLAAAGLPTIDTLGPRGGNIHSPDEFVLIDSLPERASLVALLLLHYASGQMTPPLAM